MRTVRRESDALPRGSLSGDLLGKFSAIVRRGSHLLGANNQSQNPATGEAFYDGAGNGVDFGDVSPSSLGVDALPLSTTHANKSFGFHFAANMRRFSKASATDGDVGGVDRVMRLMDGDEPERQRRYDLEVMSFADLHEHMQPPVMIEMEGDDGVEGKMPVTADDNQVEEELQWDEEEEDDADDEAVRRRSRETTADADEYDENNLSASNDEDEDDEEYDVYGDGDHSGDDDSDNNGGELNFDQANLCASVRKLVLQIESASSRGGESVQAAGATSSNQDDEEDEHPAPAQGRHSDPLVDTKPPRRVTYPMAVMPNNSHALAQNCYIPMDEVQEDLTKSVRRLVIGLKEDSEGQSATAPYIRRRGNSCPPPYCPPPPRKVSVADSMAMKPPPVPTVVEESATTAEPRRWRKRSTLARLAPKFFDNFRRKRKSYLYTDEELELIEGARWKIVELAFRFGGKHRFYLVQAVNMFFPLIKYGRHGGPHPTRLHCNRCGTLQWQHKRGGLSEAVDLADVLQVIEGRQTAVFCKYAANKSLAECSLSLIFKERTLDLETQSSSHRDWLMSALRTLVTYARKQRQAEQRAIAERALLPLEDASEASVSSSVMASSHAVDQRATVGPMLLW